MEQILTNEELKKIYFGALFFEENEEGYLRAFQYTKEQMAYFKRTESYWYDRCMASSAKTIEFTSTATRLSFEYKFYWQGSMDTFELYADGSCLQGIPAEGLSREGRISFDLANEGFPDNGEERNFILYLPVDATVGIRHFTVNAPLTPAVKGKKLLLLGDSITQGFGPLRSSKTYVSVANRQLNFDILNQGIAGYVYDRGSLMKMPGYDPDLILVSLGTNQYEDSDPRPVEEFYERLSEIYGSEIHVYVITPVWRDDFTTLGQKEKFGKFRESVSRICSLYSNITIIDGFELVPHEAKYYIDALHPNEAGAELYGNNLARILAKYLKRSAN